MGCFSSKEGLSAATVVPQHQETVDKDSASRMASKSPDSAKSSSAVPPSPNRTAVDGAQESGSSMSLLLDLGDHSLHHQEVQSSTGSSRIQRRRSQKFARKVVTTEGDFQDRNGVARRVSELDFDPVVRNECTTEEREKLHRALKKNFLFCNLEQVDCDCMINSMTRVNVAPGEIVFKQGDEGDSCYVILDGAVSVKIGDRVIKELCKGETFGELAMLYKCDRSATIRCLDSGPAVLFKIEGRSMRRYKAIINERNRKKILKFLNDDAVFANCTMSDKEQLANLCYVQEFREGDMFMREGERGECLFLLLSGRAETMDKFGNRKKVKQGAIIGELGFARTAEHAYCACALTKVTLLSFSTEELKRTFGSLQDVLRLSALKSVLSRGLFFNDLTDIQQNALVDCFEEMSCTQGMSIVTRGAHPQLILVMEGNCVMLGPDSLQKDAGIEAEGSCYQSLNRDSLLLTDGMLDNLMAVATARYGPRDMCGQENLMNGEPMPGSLLVISPTARIQRVGLDQLLQACIPEDARVKGQIQNLKDLLRLNKIRSVLSAILVFRTITKEQLDKIAFALKDRLFRANEVIYNQGDEATNEAGLFLISEGSVRIEVDGKVVRTSARWDYFGERALLQHEKRSATCIAGPKGCQCLVLDSQSFLDIVSKFRGVLENRIKLQDTDVKFKDLKPIAIVGRGTFGVVKLVVHREDESRRYALKCIDKKTGVRLKQQSFLAVEREINALCFHPCIMQFIRTFQDSRRIYFLTEFLGGGDLFSAIRQIGMLNRNQIRFFTGSIVLAIEYLHERTIMYRDLKPENVLLDDEGNTKLVDFGCCRQAQRTYTLVGTPEYLAPEVVLARGYTCTADWWSLGVMLYEFCCGPLPFGRDVDDQLELYREILESPLVFPEYVTDNRALDLMSSLLEKNPKRRLGSARGAVEIKAHDYFEGFDWDALASGYMDRPWKPNAEHTKKQWEPLDADEEAYALSEDENFVPEDWCAHF